LTNCNPYFHGLSVSDGDDAVNAGHINVALVRVIVVFFWRESLLYPLIRHYCMREGLWVSDLKT